MERSAEWYAQKRDKQRAYNARNREAVNARQLARYHAAPEKGREQRRATSRAWVAENKELANARSVQWAKDNPDRQRAKTAKYKATKLRATPAWADLDAIAKVYELATTISDLTGAPHEVDHIVPLQGENVCGLHVACNLQVLPLFDNRSKGNKHE